MIHATLSTPGWGSAIPTTEHPAHGGALQEIRTGNGDTLLSRPAKKIPAGSGRTRPDASREPPHGHGDRVTLESVSSPTEHQEEEKRKRLQPAQPTPVQQAAKRHKEQMVKVSEAVVRFFLSAAIFNPPAPQPGKGKAEPQPIKTEA